MDGRKNKEGNVGQETGLPSRLLFLQEASIGPEPASKALQYLLNPHFCVLWLQFPVVDEMLHGKFQRSLHMTYCNMLLSFCFIINSCTYPLN